MGSRCSRRTVRTWPSFVETISHRTGGERVHIDGKVSAALHSAWGLIFSADSKHFAYMARLSGERAQVVVDGKAGKTYVNASEELQFTRDGRVVYQAGNGRGLVVVVGTKEYDVVHNATVRVDATSVRYFAGHSEASTFDLIRVDHETTPPRR